MQSNNPAFNRSEVFSGRQASIDVATPTADELQDMYGAPSAVNRTGRMTYDDVVTRTGLTLGVVVLAAVVGWQVPNLAMVGLIGGLVLGLVNAFKKEPSPPLILAYAAFEGVFLGGISFMFSNIVVSGQTLDGIVAKAVVGTLIVFGIALVAYRSGKVRVTPKFQRTVLIAGAGYLVFCVFNLVAQMFGWADGMFGFRDGFLGIAIGLFAITLAAFFLILDFDFVEKGVQNGIPAKFAWTAAFGLTVTLVWLYLEFLRLFAILQSGD